MVKGEINMNDKRDIIIVKSVFSLFTIILSPIISSVIILKNSKMVYAVHSIYL